LATFKNMLIPFSYVQALIVAAIAGLSSA